MAAPYNPPVKNQDFKVAIGLQDMAQAGRLKLDPTLVAGDVTVKKNGGAAANIGTLPTVDDYEVFVTLSAAEMNTDVVTVVFHDQTEPPEWADLILSIPTVTA